MEDSDALSALDWWREAGVDVLVEETPRNWLRPARPAAEPILPPSEPVSELPATLEAFRAWLITDASLPGAPAMRVAPEGNPASGLMLLADMPEPGDAEAGQLLSGAPGRLLDRMLGAIGRDRASAYLAALAPARPAVGGLKPADEAALAPVALAHIALTAPRLLLLLGEATSRALLGMELGQARGRLHQLNHQTGTVTAIATFHPRFLLDRPAIKAAAWQDLRLLLGEMGR